MEYIRARAWGSTVKRLQIDLVGFSRGAAAARHFAHLIGPKGRDLIARCRRARVKVEAVSMECAGLFDTVAALDSQPGNNQPEGQDDDTKDLGPLRVGMTPRWRKDNRATGVRERIEQDG